MRLDSEEQRQNLLKLVLSAPLNGSFEQIAPTVFALNTLGEVIKQAPLEGFDCGAEMDPTIEKAKLVEVPADGSSS